MCIFLRMCFSTALPRQSQLSDVGLVFENRSWMTQSLMYGAQGRGEVSHEEDMVCVPSSPATKEPREKAERGLAACHVLQLYVFIQLPLSSPSCLAYLSVVTLLPNAYSLWCSDTLCSSYSHLIPLTLHERKRGCRKGSKLNRSKVEGTPELCTASSVLPQLSANSISPLQCRC